VATGMVMLNIASEVAEVNGNVGYVTSYIAKEMLQSLNR
jgi:hypothetical protein